MLNNKTISDDFVPSAPYFTEVQDASEQLHTEKASLQVFQTLMFQIGDQQAEKNRLQDRLVTNIGSKLVETLKWIWSVDHSNPIFFMFQVAASIVILSVMAVASPIIFCTYIDNVEIEKRLNQVVVFDTPEAWLGHRAKAQSMDFPTLVTTYGLDRVRRYALLANDPQENQQALQAKFTAWLQSPEVISRKWNHGEWSTPWDRFTTTSDLSKNGLCNNKDQVINSISENTQEKIVFGQQIQRLTESEFKNLFSGNVLLSRGIISQKQFDTLYHSWTSISAPAYAALQQDFKDYVAQQEQPS